ncbi:MAG: PEGA domain-containing protein [Phycisphaerae bacterium]|nr:PEGA domain-containing protein [Phycisphaerae bacterium]
MTDGSKGNRAAEATESPCQDPLWYGLLARDGTPAGRQRHRSGTGPKSGTRRTWRLRRAAASCALLGCLAFAAGCIERTVSINTEPEEATVFLNDDEVGQSPVRVPFTWYGDYDIIIRKKGYETMRTHHNIKTPWYELPGIDIFTECLVPFTVHDDRVLETFVLEPARSPDKEALLEAAAEMRQQAFGETD